MPLPQRLCWGGFLSLSLAPPMSAWLSPSPPASPFFCDVCLGHTACNYVHPHQEDSLLSCDFSPSHLSVYNIVYISLPQMFYCLSHSARVLAKRPEILLHAFLFCPLIMYLTHVVMNTQYVFAQCVNLALISCLPCSGATPSIAVFVVNQFVSSMVEITHLGCPSSPMASTMLRN